jgi:HlyD family secretion protein
MKSSSTGKDERAPRLADAAAGPTTAAMPEEPPAVTGLPVPLHVPAAVPVEAKPAQARRGWWRTVFLVVALAIGAAAGTYRWWHATPVLPPGITSGNGRIEADEIDIATKFAGRVAALYINEGDMVTAGQTLARMDTRDLEASLAKAEAQVQQAQHALEQARADLSWQKSQLKLAQQEMDRARFLFGKRDVGQQTIDQREAQLQSTTAAVKSTEARVGQAEHALEAAKQDAAVPRVNIADNTLVAPLDGRIQYRLANVGEVLGAGGKVFTMLDVASVYMDVFLPTGEAGRVRLGTDAQIVLDALPDRPIPAKVTFLAAHAQFTPKAVETKAERDKLMFRVRVRIDPELLRAHAERVRTGLPGLAYVRLDPRRRGQPGCSRREPNDRHSGRPSRRTDTPVRLDRRARWSDARGSGRSAGRAGWAGRRRQVDPARVGRRREADPGRQSMGARRRHRRPAPP